MPVRSKLIHQAAAPGILVEFVTAQRNKMHSSAIQIQIPASKFEVNLNSIGRCNDLVVCIKSVEFALQVYFRLDTTSVQLVQLHQGGLMTNPFLA